MNTCDTCKWWNSEDIGGKDSYGRVIILGKCLSVKCNELEGLAADVSHAVPYANECNVGAELHTGPKFGCIHHEAK